MKLAPRDYQRQMVQFVLDNPRANLWADPGLGKTSVTLLALDILRMMGSSAWPALVIAPLRVARDVWPGEAKKWEDFEGLRVQSLVHTKKALKAKALRTPADIYCINYESLPWLAEQLKGEWPFKTVIADECVRLKNFRLRNGGKRAAVLAKAAGKTARWLNLTGTPAPNGLIDLWGQQWFIDKGARLGNTFSAFRDRWFDYNPYRYSTTAKPHAEREIIEAISDVTLSLRAKDCFDLPPLVQNVVKVTLPAQARRIYEKFETEMAAEMEGKVIEALNAAALSMKCLQVAAGHVYTTHPDFIALHDEKLAALESIVEESGTPVLVSYHFKPDAFRIVEHFKPKGKNPSNAKILTSQRDFDDWNAGKIRVGLVHPDSAGHGLSLQDGGHTLVFYQAWWDLEKHDQVIERLGPTRQMQSGRNCPVIVHYLVAEDTVDEQVMERLRTKRSVQDLLRERVKR